MSSNKQPPEVVRNGLRPFVDERLCAMHARPKMWAGNKESFALQVALLVEVVSSDFSCAQLLSKFFPGTNAVPTEDFDDAWAHAIIEIARKELP